MIDAKHIAALEAWLQKTREDQNQLIARLREAESEAARHHQQQAAGERGARAPGGRVRLHPCARITPEAMNAT